MPTPDDIKTMALPDIVANYPSTKTVLEKYGLHTYADSETAKHENIQASALVHNVDLEALLTELSHAAQ